MTSIQLDRRTHRIGLQVAFAAFLFATYLAIAASVDVIPFPGEILSALRIQIYEGGLIDATVNALYAILAGYLLAILVGIPLGLFLGVFRTAEQFFDPYLDALYSLPLAAIVPAFIIWFGTGFQTRVAGVFFFAIFPIVINTMQGAKDRPESLLEAGRSFGASRLFLIRHVILPYEATYIATGLRLSINLAVKGLVVVEVIVAVTGFGALVYQWGTAFQLGGVFSIVLVLMGLGLVLTWLVSLAERRLIHWDVSDVNEY